MTFVTILNVVLAVAVVVGLLRLHSWAIISSPRDQQPARAAVHPYARPHLPRVSAARSHHRPEWVEPVAG
jgi:hypothetical protein